MNKLPTAEEFLNNYTFESAEQIGNRDFDVMIKYAKDFTKLHIEAALKAVKESGENCFGDLVYRDGGKNIEKAYPLNKII